MIAHEHNVVVLPPVPVEKKKQYPGREIFLAVTRTEKGDILASTFKFKTDAEHSFNVRPNGYHELVTIRFTAVEE